MEKTYKIISACLIVLLLGLSIYLYLSRDKETVVIPDTKKEQQTIDSLKTVIEVLEDSVARVKEKIVYIKEVKIVERIKEIKELPLDSGTLLLKTNLVKYGELTENSDTFPKNLPDSLVIISEDNVKDMNIIVAKYEGELEINQNLENIVAIDSVMLEDKDSMLLMKDSIIEKNLEAYEIANKGLKDQLKRSRITGGVVGGTLGIITITLLSILLTR